ncbi:DUF839 domain-containing protein [Aliiglaciecola sp. CAU 1673]|uniref:PhoX family protein n=1 Tax=Aliiglaciecola sp. CAU 1673 TaxID=3032595 RepID=UPI0023DB2845|nr:alkaline phosphatase PhoX [Aliiglaciecola sp. CAU 1673]MDF2178072.1 DUF839 domain-containing protein [Aliiglaciecola sp. CAU 1673]
MLKQNLKLSLLAVSVVFALTACSGDDGTDGATGSQGPAGQDGAPGAPGVDGAAGQDLTAAPKLSRVATVPVGAEITGMFVTDNDELFFNVQHPEDLDGNATPAQVGFVANLDWSKLDPRTAELTAPTTDAEKMAVRVVSGSYQALGMADGHQDKVTFGLGAIVSSDGTTELKQSQDPDFNAFIAADAAGKEGYLFTAWEDRPGTMSRMALSMQDDGTWSVGDIINVDFSGVLGTIINCFGSLSPWGTPLTSEENYEAENTSQWNNTAYVDGYPSYTDIKLLMDYLGTNALPNPYNYGYIVEVTDAMGTNPTPVKHYTLGRAAHENALVMPDWKTVYTTDDGTNKGFYKFVAKTAGDLSEGTLYAAKLTQDSTSDAAKAGFDIQWIELGTASNAQIATWIADYDGITEADYVEGQTSYITDAEIQEWADNGTGDDRYAFLETLKAAKAKGATVEFRKMEGIAINYNGAANNSIPYMYVAMSEVRSGMTDGQGDIQVDESARCGAVYRFGLHPDYNVTRMDPVVVGGAYNSQGDEHGNRCDVNGISNPDNLAVLDDGRVLIGEDTSNHTNNAMWIYNPKGE